MIKKTILGAALLGLASFAPGAGSAAVAEYNFEQIADDFWDATAGSPGGSYEGSWGQVTGWLGTPGQMIDNGITITAAKSTYQGNPENTHPFFDHAEGHAEAGLGVCHSGATADGVSKCSSPNGSDIDDDNVTFEETLTLLFDQSVFISDILFRNANHNLMNGNLEINGAVYSVTNGILDAAERALIGMTDTFEFAYFGTDADKDQNAFYLSNLMVDNDPDNIPPIPLPAGGLLLLGGLGALGALKRKRKA